MARATWNGLVLAETSHPVLLEANVYVRQGISGASTWSGTRAWSVCPWKGLARYYTVQAGGRVNKNAAWYYPHSSPLARKIRNHVAFWNGVQVDARTAQAQEAPEAGISAGPEAACEPGMPLALRADRGRGL